MASSIAENPESNRTYPQIQISRYNIATAQVFLKLLLSVLK